MTTTRHTAPRTPRAAAGFTLVEVLLAMALFGLVMASLVQALALVSKAAVRNGDEVRIVRNLETLLTEASKASRLEERDEFLDEVDGIAYELVVEEMTEIYNMDEQPLQGMWRIAVTATFERNGELIERVAETFRYEPLYQNQ